MGRVVDPGDEIDADRWAAISAAAIADPCDALPEQVRSSSKGRPWRGLAVWHQVGPPGDLYIPRVNTHTILVRRVSSTVLVQRQGATIRRRHWQPGEAIIVPSGVPTFWRSESARDNIHIDLDPSWLQRVAGGDEARLPSCFGQPDPVLTALASALIASLHTDASLQPSFADGMSQSLAAHLLARYAQTSRRERSTAALSRRELDRITALVREDLSHRWSVSQMADAVDLSCFHFCRSFKAASGQSPHAYVTRLRMEEALRQVRASSRPFLDIALDTGYSTATHFSQTFRRHWGITPREARRAHRLAALPLKQEENSRARTQS
ncbi:MAG TPA: AraC family transcriptional regulator [Burkholderiaceae bacterium]|nr:AraC family transcriptional regulator [Burkholderiaceae bacterium]